MEFLKILILLVPELFVSNYSKKCQNKTGAFKQPIIVSDEEANKYRAEGHQVMVFPKEGDTEYTEQRNYVCIRDPKLKYPGLIKKYFPGAVHKQYKGAKSRKEGWGN